MKITFVGCGDAFGSGGRFNTCFHVETSATRFLIDCGASSLVAIKQLGIERNAIDLILITHFHADHFGGIPFFILDAQFLAKRTRPLVIAGPAGLEEWYARTMETAFPGSSAARLKFDLSLIELAPDIPWSSGGIEVLAALVRHGQSDGPFHAYRIAVDDRVIAYTGDTEWTDSLVDIGQGADLMIAEAYFFDKKVPLHLDYTTLIEKLPLIGPKRLVLTHMNEDMLNQTDGATFESAHDGLILTI